MLRRLPKILRFIPGKAQDMRAWFLSMQYWLGGSDDNIEQMIRFLVGRYARLPDWQAARARRRRSITPMSASITPTLPGADHHRCCADLPRPAGADGDGRSADAAQLCPGLGHRAL
ncbi:MAG: DUF3479 domain-containing protein [Desulfobacterales bacterium]|nr:DUF3479 domain-containing protein [Desulfobacterales bacterium]